MQKLAALAVALTLLSGPAFSQRAEEGKPADGSAPPISMGESIVNAIDKGECEKGLALLETYRKAKPVTALLILRILYANGKCVPKDLGKEFETVREAAEIGGFIPEAILADMYLKGMGTPKDASKASYWFKKSALLLVRFSDEDRIPFLMRMFGDDEIPAAYMDELAWIRGIEQGDPERLYNLALRFRDGEGFSKDCKVAEIWMEMAAYKKLPKAQYEYGKWILEDICVKSYVRKGLGWMEEAGAAGHMEAQKYLGFRFAKEKPSEIANYAAYYWLHLAQSSGADVKDVLTKVEARMTKKEKELSAYLLKEKTIPAWP